MSTGLRFNQAVITPDGDGYVVARDANSDKLLVCIKQPADKGHSRCKHVFYPVEKIQAKDEKLS